ncbi:MAG: cyanate transporter [Bauldia sp.]|nr:cyanate transporter [Bauldia sp.]
MMTGRVGMPAPRRAALVFLIVVIALNLRPFLAAPGPILPRIAEDTGLSAGALSLLTLLPMLLMGIGAFASPPIQARYGTRRGLMVALSLLFLGAALRIFAINGAVLILTAVLCGAGVAFIQSAVPGLIKEKFSASVAGMTGLYSAMIMTGGALGAQLTPMLVESGWPWTSALAFLSLPVLLALATAARFLSETRVVRPERGLVARLLRRRRTWVLMAVFGLINGSYSSLIAWLAPYYQAQGWSGSESGALISTMAISQGFGAVILPLLARNRPDRRPWLWACIAMQAIGFTGLVVAPSAVPMLWVAICGVGLAGSFALCLIVALDHLPDPARAGPLAALMQGGGFILSGVPPLVLARIYEATGSFAGGWVMHLGWLAAAAILVARFNPERYAEAME